MWHTHWSRVIAQINVEGQNVLELPKMGHTFFINLYVIHLRTSLFTFFPRDLKVLVGMENMQLGTESADVRHTTKISVLVK
jgi:hypothetical protein